MNSFLIVNRRLWAVSILAISFVLSLVFIQAEAASNDSSIKIEKDPYSGKFTLTFKDPDGIQEFSLSLVGRYSYGGGLSSCPKSFSTDNVVLMDPSDFTPVMPAYIVDCKNNKTELEIPPPVDGVTKSVKVKKEEEASPPPTPQKEEKKEEKKEGPLSAEDIAYPVSDLGNCTNETECRSYCDSVDHAKECFVFAKKYHLISDEDAEKAADHFLNITNGPGGCNSGKSCEAYCSTIEHIDECIAFAEKTGYYESEELAEAKKFQALIKAGKQFPGGCTDRNTCEIYCNDPNHMQECLNFAEESGFMPPEEIAEAKKFMTLMQKGESPGGCTSKEQCENYCFEENHIEECIAFSEKAGVMSPEDAEMARKIGGKGPGNCRSKEQCDAYCQDHSEECFHFAEEHGLINEDDLQQMRDGMKRFREELNKMPPEAVACMKDAAGEENFNKMIAGEPVFDRSIEEKMKSCFGQVTAQFSKQLSDLPPETAQCIKDVVGDEGLQKLQHGEFDKQVNFESLERCFQQLQASFGGSGNFSDGGFSGPGGCTNTEECSAYCQEHPDECQGFGPPGHDDAGFSGPGGCTSQEECQAYCQEHPQECKGFAPPDGNTGGGGSDSRSCLRPPSGLVSWWSADLASETIVPDINNKHNGTISGGVAIIPMEVGSAFNFDGSSGYISIGAHSGLNFGTDPFSLEAWFNWNGGGGTSANNIIRKSNYPGSGPGSGYWLRVGNGTLEFSVGATTGPEGQSIITAPISTGVWHHAIGTKDSSGAIKLYVDGQSVGTVLRQAVNANSTSEVPFLIGAWSLGGGASEFFNGQIDEVSIYNRALGASEAQDLFDSGSVGKCSSDYGHANRELPQDYQQQYQQPPMDFGGPGGCKTPEECKIYCMQNYQDSACQKFMPPDTSSSPPQDYQQPPQEYQNYQQSQPSTDFGGPGGCASQEECTTYCTQNYQDPACEKFISPGTSSSLFSSPLIHIILGPLLFLFE